jgi:hypothetical protein
MYQTNPDLRGKSQSHDFDFFVKTEKSQSRDFDFFEKTEKSQSHDFDFDAGLKLNWF